MLRLYHGDDCLYIAICFHDETDRLTDLWGGTCEVDIYNDNDDDGGDDIMMMMAQVSLR